MAPGRQRQELLYRKFYNRSYGIYIFDLLVAAAIILVRICGLFDLQAEILRIDSEEGGYMSLIEIRNLNKYYRIGKNSFHVLKDINLHVERGDFISIEGKSGAGKSTLLNLLGCIDTFDSGEYCLDGKQIERLSEAKLAAVRNTKIGYVFQDFCLVNYQSVLFNTMLPLFFNKTSYAEMKRLGLQALERVGISDQARKKANQLSGGQRQRVAIARAIISRPDVILADEPTGALDSATSVQIMELLAELNAEGATVIVVTHDKAVSDYCRKHLVIKDGQIVEGMKKSL